MKRYFMHTPKHTSIRKKMSTPTATSTGTSTGISTGTSDNTISEKMLAALTEVINKGMKVSAEEQKKIDEATAKAKEAVAIEPYINKYYSFVFPEHNYIFRILSIDDDGDVLYLVNIEDINLSTKSYKGTGNDVRFVVKKHVVQMSLTFEDYRGRRNNMCVTFGINGTVIGRNSIDGNSSNIMGVVVA